MARKGRKQKGGTRKTRGARPPKRRCGAMGVHHLLLETSPSFRRAQSRMESGTSRMMQKGMAEVMPPKPRLIPVVVHILYRNEADNLSDAQIESQISALNKDFRATNPDKSRIPPPFKGLLADAMMEFRLATKDDYGKRSTGITRTRTNLSSFPANDSMKSTRTGGVKPWDTRRFLNIWVCRLSGNLLGYAQFPGGPRSTDGVVILTTAFGTRGNVAAPFNKGRTTTHEIGHYFNLRHIWGDREDCFGSDLVNDTPNALAPNFGAPTFPRISCSNGPNGDMFMNYMDYVNDDAMQMFSSGQAARMQAALTMARNGLGT